MGRKIEIELNENLLEEIKKKAKEESMKVETYIENLIMKKQALLEQELGKVRKRVIQELEVALRNMKEAEENNTKKGERANKVIVLSLKMYDKALPEEIEKRIQHYRDKGWFQEENFYLITDRRKLVGYFGLSFQEEPMPFGRYIFIYGFNLLKEYQYEQNLKYIFRFIEAIAKKEDYLYMDIASTHCNVSHGQLKALGFLELSNSKWIEGKIVEGENENRSEDVKDVVIKEGTFPLDEIEEYLPAARVQPIKISRMNWEGQPSEVRCMQLLWIKDGEPVKVFIVEEKKHRKGEEIRGYTLLVKPEVLYDTNTLFNVYEQVLRQIVAENQGQKIFIGYPQDLEKVGEKIVNGIKQAGIWYRKITS